MTNNFYKRLSIGTRLGTGLGCAVMLIIGLLFISIYSIKGINNKMTDIVQRNNKQIWYANIIKDSVHTECEAMLTKLFVNDEAVQSFEDVKILTAKATYRDTIEKLTALEDTGEGKDLILRLERVLDAVEKSYAQLIAYHWRHKEKTSRLFVDAVRPYILSLQQITSELVSYEERQTSVKYQQALATYAAMRGFFIVFGIVVVMIAIVSAYFFTRSITKPLRQAADIADSLAAGDIPPNVEIKRYDETGRLLESMHNMVEKLSQMKELEHQLHQSQKLETVGRLVGGIAHDFNNMLSIILGNAQLIKMNQASQSKVMERCSIIESTVMKASDFVKQLLAFSKKQILELRPIDLNNVVKDFEKIIRKMVGENIDIVIRYADEKVSIKADVAQLQQILLNLIVNAKEAMSGNGRIVIKTEMVTIVKLSSFIKQELKPGDYMVLSVSDTGVGIDAAIKDNIFEPFFTTKQTGTGLGLSVVYGIVKQHSGCIEVLDNKGGGTTFRIYIPCNQGEVESADAREKREIIKGRNERILIVEDDENLRKTISEALQTIGYRIKTASDGLEGINVFLAQKNAIDMVILDVIMPKLGGFEAYKEMKKARLDIPMLFVTGYNPEDNCHDTVNEIQEEIIYKPYSIDQLSQKIRVILDKKSSQRTDAKKSSRIMYGMVSVDQQTS